MEYVILGLGSNVGDRAGFLAAAAEGLRANLRDMIISSAYETPALLPEGAPPEWDMPYLNRAVSGWTSLPPRALLAETQVLEKKLGRAARGHWGPREIDIDILAYGALVVNEPDLVIPHARLPEREFALKPLAEIAPDWRYPHGVYQGKTAKELAELLS